MSSSDSVHFTYVHTVHELSKLTLRVLMFTRLIKRVDHAMHQQSSAASRGVFHVAGLKKQKACAAKFQPGEDYEHCVEGTHVPLGL